MALGQLSGLGDAHALVREKEVLAVRATRNMISSTDLGSTWRLRVHPEQKCMQTGPGQGGCLASAFSWVHWEPCLQAMASP